MPSTFVATHIFGRLKLLPFPFRASGLLPCFPPSPTPRPPPSFAFFLLSFVYLLFHFIFPSSLHFTSLYFIPPFSPPSFPLFLSFLPYLSSFLSHRSFHHFILTFSSILSSLPSFLPTTLSCLTFTASHRLRRTTFCSPRWSEGDAPSPSYTFELVRSSFTVVQSLLLPCKTPLVCTHPFPVHFPLLYTSLSCTPPFYYPLPFPSLLPSVP
jgi:hypothetical protein